MSKWETFNLNDRARFPWTPSLVRALDKAVRLGRIHLADATPPNQPKDGMIECQLWEALVFLGPVSHMGSAAFSDRGAWLDVRRSS